MEGSQVIGLVTQLTAADPGACDRRGLADLVNASQRVRGWLDAFDARIAIRAGELADHGVCESPSSLLAGDGRRAAKDADAAARRGAVCDLLPKVHDALASGSVSAGHADALARVARELDDEGRSELQELEETLVASAQTSTVDKIKIKQ